MIESSAELRFITVTATGFDCVDVAAARQRGIPVSNVPEYSTQSVAQFVFALLLELCQNVAKHADAVTAGEWTSQPDFSLRKTPLFELAGKTMGIVGFGRIGRQVARDRPGIRNDGPGVDNHFARAARRKRPMFEWCELDELFARSDVISLHCPLTPQTAGLVNRERLATSSRRRS